MPFLIGFAVAYVLAPTVGPVLTTVLLLGIWFGPALIKEYSK